MLVIGRSGVEGHDPPEAGGVAGLQLLHLRLAHLPTAAEAFRDLARGEQGLAGDKPLEPPDRRIEEDEVERGRVLPSPGSATTTLRMGRPSRILWMRTAATRASTLASSPTRRAPMGRTSAAILVGLGRELQRILHRLSPPFLEERARRRVGPGQVAQRGGELLAALLSLRGSPGLGRGRRQGGGLGNRRGSGRGLGGLRCPGRQKGALEPAPSPSAAALSTSTRPARAASRSSGGSGMRAPRSAAMRITVRRRAAAGTASKESPSARSRRRPASRSPRAPGPLRPRPGPSPRGRPAARPPGTRPSRRSGAGDV